MNTDYLLHLADSCLILSHRNSEWCGHGPVLEQDIAITNIALDLLGQGRSLYQYTATLIGNTDEDQLVGFRSERDFKNLLLTELPKGDWAFTVLRQYFFSQYQFLLFNQLQHNSDTTLAAIAAKSIKETKYHLRWSGEWVLRLGDGTIESHRRIQEALNELWSYTGEMFMPAAYEQEMNRDYAAMQQQWSAAVNTTLTEATLSIPEGSFMHSGGKTGMHTEHFGYILNELQYMQRSYPGCEW